MDLAAAIESDFSLKGNPLDGPRKPLLPLIELDQEELKGMLLDLGCIT